MAKKRELMSRDVILFITKSPELQAIKAHWVENSQAGHLDMAVEYCPEYMGMHN
jgi:hypothetical protein